MDGNIMMHPTTFEYLKPTDEQIDTLTILRANFKRTADLIESVIPEGRYRRLAITALEEAAMWANKGVTRDSDGTPRAELHAPASS
jgi:hypothetical protein